MSLTLGVRSLCDWQQKIFDLVYGPSPPGGMIVISNHTRGNVGVSTLINYIRCVQKESEDSRVWLLWNCRDVMASLASRGSPQELFTSSEQMIVESDYEISTKEAEKIIGDLILLRQGKTTLLFLELMSENQVPDLSSSKGQCHYVLSDSEEGKKNNGAWRGKDAVLTRLS